MLDLDQVRARFPALARRADAPPRVYLDNPAGTQIAQPALGRIHDCLVHSNANVGGAFVTSLAAETIVREAHAAMADLLNAPSAREIVFGPNMTTLTFALSRSLATRVRPGQNLVVTRLDHDANVTPWLRLAEETGTEVRWLDFNPDDGRLGLEQLNDLLDDRTFLVAAGYASNLLGTVNPVAHMVAQARAVGALSFVDAVHFVPHGPVDVQALGADFLVCSPYKFFGPHQGVLWGREEHLETLPAWRVRPASPVPPGKFETGTQNHEGQAGTLGAVEYLAWLGRQFGQAHPVTPSAHPGRRLDLHRAMTAIRHYEMELSRLLLQRLQELPGLKIWGWTNLNQPEHRVPTVSFTLKGRTPAEIARHLARQNIFVWDGHAYAVEVVRRLGLEDHGGVLRVGAVHYNTPEEIERLVQALRTLP